MSGVSIVKEDAPDAVSLEEAMPMYGISEEIYREALDITSQSDDWDPTGFANALLKYYTRHLNSGGELIVITARPFRESVEAIFKRLLHYEIPIVSCKSKFKHLMIKDGSLIFEDHPLTALNCAEKLKHSHVFVPKWSWNKYLEDRSDLENLTVLEQDHIMEDANGYIEEALAKNWRYQIYHELSPLK